MLDRNLEDTLPYLFTLLGISEPMSSLQQMDPQIRRQRTFEAIKRMLVHESLNQPLILIFEDLHWLDGETQAFLTLLSESLATAKILLLVNYRPEYQHSWGNKTFYTQLRLDPLGQEDAQELLTALLGNDPTFPPVKRFILEKTEGNPFFMEEIVQALVEQEVLPDPRRVGTAHLDVGAHSFGLAPSTGHAPLPSDLHLPTTVQAVLASRIDRLPAEEKALLQTLAVIGKEFPLSLLKQVVDKPEEDLHRLLSHLQAAEFIYEQPAFPEMEYTFKHALTQEVAYNSLLIERRKALHERTAQAIEAIFHSRLEDHYGDLAHHSTRSGNTQKAIEYLQRAGEQAVQRSAHAEAISHLTTGLDLLQILPDTSERARQELSLQITLSVPLRVTKGHAAPEVEHAYSRARELCQQIGETPQLFPVLWGLAELHFARAEFQTQYELGEQLLSLAQSAQDPALLLEAQRVLGANSVSRGKFARARAHLEQGIALYDAQPHRSSAFLSGLEPGVALRSNTARVLWFLGYPDQARTRSRETLTLAQELSHPFSLAFALTFAGWLCQCRREGQAAQERAEAAIALCTEQGFQYWLSHGTILRGWALAEQGQGEKAITQMRQGLVAARATEAEVSRSYHLALLAEVCGKVGQAEEGLSVLAEALATVEKTGERFYEAELHRLKGQLTLQKFQVSSSKFQVQESLESSVQGLESEAEEYFLRAIEIARLQQAKSLELRAVMSLSRLWQQQGKKEEARQTLAEVYGWFTEGFDTADLQEAKTLLEELSQGGIEPLDH
jgi:predicted ATPase